MDEMREALERIVALDYRGHPSMEQTIARAALADAGYVIVKAEDVERWRAIPDHHIVEFTATAYHLEHPLACREKGLRLCDWQGYLAQGRAPVREPGRYVMTWGVRSASFIFTKETP